MTDEVTSQVPPDPAPVLSAPAGPVGPPSSLDLWARAQVLHRCFGDDDGEPHIMRGLD
ncbi:MULTISPECIES: hypothetical protein [unclassified Micromonospora]|uniref:hypothetical protein n=1 Tax=unclassified Micromonospora TaxID=2617518 RepID=UPI001B38BBC5|nr:MULTISPECIES: hypothetical protein [unclassified Micromonospora]MBQ1041370.1 hypothetical protein [Micromonospora sp. C72]MBQ1054830.1 hypothetical protein [Micromonospora sp. C32]